MKAGPRDQKIGIQRKTATTDDYGGEIETWADYAAEWAEYKPGTGQERRQAAQEAASLAATFRVLDNGKTRFISPASDRLIYNGYIWDITSSVRLGRDGIEITATTGFDSSSVLPVSIALEGTLTGGGLLVAALRMGIPLAGAVSSAGAAIGVLKVATFLNGSASGVGSASGDLSAGSGFSGAFVGIGALSGGLTARVGMAGAASGAGSGVATLIAAARLTGSVAAAGIGAGELTAATATTLGPIETGNAILASSNNGGITNGQARGFTVHAVRGSGSTIMATLTGVEWDTMSGEILLPSYDAKLAIEFPLGSGTFGAVTSATVASGDRYKDVTIDAGNWTDGQQFGLWVWGSGTRLPSIGTSGANNTQLYTDEACEVGASVSQTPVNASGMTDSLTRRRRMCIVAGLFSQIPTSAKTVACIGDSIMAYQTSNLAANSATADHVRGDVVRSLSQYYACLNLGLGGDQPSSALYSDRTLQRLLARRCTHMFDENGVNEMENRQISGAAAWAFHLRFRETFPAQNYAHSTLVPRTSGTYTSEAGQTPVTTGSKTANINAYNVLARAAADQTWDRRVLIQGTNTDVWAAPGGVATALDGLHPALAGQDLIIADKATGKAKVDAATNPAGVQPSLALALTGTPTFSGGKFVRGTATLDGAAASGLPSTTEFYATATAVSAFDVLCGSAGRLFVNSSGIPTYTRQSTGTQYQAAAPASIVGTGERFFRIVTTATGTNVYMDDMATPLITVAVVPNSTQTNTRIVATATNSAGQLRDLSSWAANRTGAAIPTAGAIPASQGGLVAYWPLATDASGQIGPWLTSI